MSVKTTRRQFVTQAGIGGAGLLIGVSPSIAKTYQANGKLSIGVVGVGGQGRFSIDNLTSENLVALCDVDDNNLREAARRFPGAATFIDFRKMLEQTDLDAVVVATPDHTHAVAGVAALKAGNHLYCEKPLAHNVREVQVMVETAFQHKRATQMGTQIHAGDNYRRCVEIVQSGAIGPVSEVHVFVGGAYTADGRPKDTQPVPENLHWDLWLGPAPVRPYNSAYAPFRWRSWWDFGGGLLADMACHHIDLPFWALGLRHPLTVEAEGPTASVENPPPWLTVRYTFAARGDQPAVNLKWYSGPRPPIFAERKLPDWGNGTLFVGEKGMLLCDYGRYVLLPETQYSDFKPPEPTIAASVGHHREWVNACKTGSPTLCNFDYAGALAETVLLGNVAYRANCKLDWDASSHRATNCPDADRFLRREYRRGWSL